MSTGCAPSAPQWGVWPRLRNLEAAGCGWPAKELQRSNQLFWDGSMDEEAFLRQDTFWRAEGEIGEGAAEMGFSCQSKKVC